MSHTHLYFVRHGETNWNAQKRMQGHQNSELTSLGKKQARLLGDKLAELPITSCYTSDSQRAIETAQLVCHHLPLIPQTDSRLREIAMGTWEGRTHEEIVQTNSRDWQQFWAAPHLFQGQNDGETFHALQTRSMACINELITAHPNQAILIISHRLTIKTIICSLLKQNLTELTQLADIEPNSMSLIELADSHASVLSYSDISHYN